MARLAPFIKQQFFGDNGEPLAGGKIHTYISGTSTPLVTYTDQTGNVANTNPIVLDSNGEASIWLSDAYYKFIIKDANDVTLRTVDKVSVTNDTTAEAASAKEAAEIAQAAAELAETNAEAYALASAASAADASASETNAEASASSAAGFASDAESARDAAIIARDEAEGFVTDAQFYASLSANNNDEAYNNATLAQEWAIKTTATVDGSDYSAKEWAKGTLTRGAASGGSSKDWANYTGDTVDDTEYSAKKYALDAAQSASDAAQSALDAAGASSNPVVGFTAGSVVFSVGSNAAGEDNSNFFWDDTNKLFGIGTNTPNTVGSTGRKNLVIAGSTNAGLTIKAGAGYVASINFTDTDGANQGLITYDTISDEMAFFTGVTPAQAMRIDSSGNVGIGTSSPANKLHLEGSEQLVSATQLTVEGYFAGYGAGINFVSRTSPGGTRVSMAKITADGEASWDTTAANQDAGLRFFTAQDGSLSERMRIDSSGYVGIGTAPASTYSLKTAARIIVNGMVLGEDSSGTGTRIENASGLDFRAANSGTNHMSISNSGVVTIGIAGVARHIMHGGLSGAVDDSRVILRLRQLGAANSDTVASMVSLMDINGDVCGTITINPSANTAAYNTSSDARLKQNAHDFDGLNILSQIKVKEYERISSPGPIEHGVLAQQVHEVYPQAVTVGGEDPQTAPWCVDYSKFVPVLMKSVQELKAKVEILENKLQTPNVGGPA